MERNKINRISTLLQWGIFLFVNILFVYKFSSRLGLNPYLCAIIYGVAITGLEWLYHQKISPLITEHLARNISLLLSVGIVVAIGLAIFLIDPLTIRVDRWSATSYFLDALFQGIYPYSVHTHVCETNYPSPFPLWQYLNLPFWFIGDVGWIQAFYLLLFLAAVWYYFHSWRSILSIVILLCISPSYWWEIATRSDGVSNILLVFSCILFIQRKPIKMSDRWWLLALFSGCIASTRLSSLIPMALFLFRPWLDINWRKKIGFVCIALSVVIFFLLPYVFWDTTNWVFFERNPFITQTLQGNNLILIVMIIAAITIAYKKQTFNYYINTTSAYMFAFMLASELGMLWAQETPATFFDTCCDISYFTLSLPFAIVALVINQTEKNDKN